jgi:DMAP1-binding Domain
MSSSNASPGRRPIPPDVLSRLAQIEHEYQHGELTQRGYEIRRSRIISPLEMENFNFNFNNNDTSGRENSAVFPPLPRFDLFGLCLMLRDYVDRKFR